MTFAIVACFVTGTAVCSQPSFDPTESITITVKTRTGGSVAGPLVAHSDHGIVLLANSTPLVFAWNALETKSALGARRDIQAWLRSGAEHLTARDHFEQGLFALERFQGPLAIDSFQKAERLDPAYGARARAAIKAHREARAHTQNVGRLPQVKWRSAGAKSFESNPLRTTPEIRTKAMEVYESLGAMVVEVFGKAINKLETDHFVIWTDWPKAARKDLGALCEATYAALCDEFGFDPEGNVFIAKCPVFCWQSKARFQRFAQQFDGHDGRNAIGYTRSIAENGHVHIVLLRQGRTQADFDRFASTLVHEATHAFIHRSFSTRLIPHWINEGLADMVAERLLADRCNNAEDARLLAQQYVRYDWPVTRLLSSVGPIDVHDYPVAHSIVSFLYETDHLALSRLIADLKEGKSIPRALADRFNGMTLQQLEQMWRASVRNREAEAGL